MGLAIDLQARRAAVTGVTSGIGAGIAEALAQAGCDVSGCGLDATESPGAQAFRQSVRDAGRRAFYSQVNISAEESPGGWIEEAAAAMGGLDILVSNAGRNIFTGVLETTESQWRECINLNLASHWRVAKAAYPFLKKAAPGVILIIASNHAYRTLPGCFPYNIAKAGLLALVQSLAIEWGPKIRVVGIAPGFVETPGSSAWFQSFPDPAAKRNRTLRLHPTGRLGTPAEIGAWAAFLASDHAAFMTGTTHVLDGGRSALLLDPPDD